MTTPNDKGTGFTTNDGGGSASGSGNPKSGSMGGGTMGSGSIGTGSSGSGAGTGSGMGSGMNTGYGSSSAAIGADKTTAPQKTSSMAGGTCHSCGQTIGETRDAGLETFLGRLGISETMINNLKSSFQNVDIDEYLNTARTYLKDSGTYLKDTGTKANSYAKENPGKVAAGVAALAVGAGLLINAISNRDSKDDSSE